MNAGKLRQLFQNLNLRAKVTLGIALPLILILSITTVIEFKRHQNSVLTNLSLLASKSNQIIENSILHEMINRDIEGLQAMLDEIGKDPSIRSVSLLDVSGKIVFSPVQEEVGTVLDKNDQLCRTCHDLPQEDRPGSVVISLPDGQRVFRSMIPIENRPTCYACHEPTEQTIGLLLTDFWVAPLENPLRNDLIENILWRSVSILMAVIVANLVLSSVVLGRIEKLSHAIQQFGRGKFDVNVFDSHQDEIGQLSASYQEMAERVNTEVLNNRTLSENLRRQSAQRGELLRRLTTVQEAERKRIARDLHDELGQVLTGLSFNMELLEKMLPNEDPRVKNQLKEARGLINDTSNHMYDLIFTLRPSVLDDLGLISALKAYMDRVLNGTGIEYKITNTNLSKRMPAEIETALYRVFQEAINNTIRHSEASKISIHLKISDHMFHGEIVDDGNGFDPNETGLIADKPCGFGILGMKERVMQCNGTIEILSDPGVGTRIRIHLPLDEVSDE